MGTEYFMKIDFKKSEPNLQDKEQMSGWMFTLGHNVKTEKLIYFGIFLALD